MFFKKHYVNRGESGEALIDIVSACLVTSRKKAKVLIDSRNVLVNSKRVWMARHRVVSGDVVEIPARFSTHDASDKIGVLFRDDNLVVVDKPPGILTNGSGSLELRLRADPANANAESAHRLDRDTSGCIVFALNAHSKKAMEELFRGRGVTKMYHAVVAGMIRSGEMTLNRRLDNKTAVSRIRVLDANRVATHLGISILTGRTHQIRKHLQMIGHPVLGDSRYAFGRPERRLQETRAPRQMLHASKIFFSHPLSGAQVKCEAPLPPDFRQILKALKLT